MKKRFLFFALLLISLGNYAQTRQHSSHITCQAYKMPIAYIDTVLKAPKTFTSHSERGCVFKLLDTLTTLAVNGNQQSLDALNKLYSSSDGDVSEYFLDVGVKLFYDGFGNTIEYLFKNCYHKKGNNLEKAVIEAISMQISDASDRRKEKMKIHTFIVKKEKELGLPSSKREYLDALEKKFNPAMFD